MKFYFYTNNKTKKFLKLILANDIQEADLKFEKEFNLKLNKCSYIGVQVKKNFQATLPRMKISKV